MIRSWNKQERTSFLTDRLHNLCMWSSLPAIYSCLPSTTYSLPQAETGFKTRLRKSLETMMLCGVHAATEGQAGVCSPATAGGPGWCTWPVLPPKAIRMFMVCAAAWSPMLVPVSHTATGGHAEICGAHWHQRPGECPWSILSPDTTWKSTICAPDDCEGRGASSVVVSMTEDSQLRRRVMDGFCDNPHSTSQK